MSSRIGGPRGPHPAQPLAGPQAPAPTTALDNRRAAGSPVAWVGGFDGTRDVSARHMSLAHITAAHSVRVNPPAASSTTPAPGAPGASTDPAPGAPAPTTPPAPLTPPLELKKKAVRRAELALKRAGFRTGAVDGEINASTRKALSHFQRAIGLDPTGQLDRKTYDRLQQVARRARKHKNKVVGPGQRGRGIRKMQLQLRKLGYDVGQADGIFDTKVADAARAFKRDQKNLKGRNGLIGPQSLKVLRNESKRLNHNPYRSRVKASAKRKGLDKRTAKAAARRNRDGSRGFGVGSKGPTVAYVQQHLRAAGYDPKSTKGRFDERTEGALKQFQRRSELPVTGRIDARTWRHLQRSTIEATGAFSPAQRIGEKSSAVKRSEKLLKALGFNPGSRDGLYTKQTQKALDAFRRKYKLKGRGKGISKSTYKAMKRIRKKQQNPFGKAISTLGYVSGVPRRIKVVKVEGSKMLELETAKAYVKMKKAAAKDGVYLQLNSGFRTMAEQQALYAKYGSPRAARPGYSNHQSGVALDLNTSGTSMSHGTGPVYNWLARNAHKFGFKRIPLEHWHWEYQPSLAKYRR